MYDGKGHLGCKLFPTKAICVHFPHEKQLQPKCPGYKHAFCIIIYAIYIKLNLAIFEFWWHILNMILFQIEIGGFIIMYVFWYRLERIFVHTKRSPDYYVLFVNFHVPIIVFPNMYLWTLLMVNFNFFLFIEVKLRKT